MIGSDGALVGPFVGDPVLVVELVVDEAVAASVVEADAVVTPRLVVADAAAIADASEVLAAGWHGKKVKTS